MRPELAITACIMSILLLVLLLITETFDLPAVCVLYSFFVPMIIFMSHLAYLIYKGKI